jgi:hypothetical protein
MSYALVDLKGQHHEIEMSYRWYEWREVIRR